MSTRPPRSVLDDLGAELTGIVAPTSLCMVATLAVTNILNPNGESDTNAVWLAQAVYSEQVSPHWEGCRGTASGPHRTPALPRWRKVHGWGGIFSSLQGQGMNLGKAEGEGA
jgi:hypothetical protein